MSQLYTNREAASKTGIPESTIRTWLSRYPGVFQLGVHLIADEHNQKLWTEAGIELLLSRRGTKNATDDVSESVAFSDSTDLLETLLEQDARALAEQYWRLLPGRLLHRIKQMRFNPTPQDQQIVQASIRSALNTGTEHLLLPTYQPMLLEGGNETD